MTILEAIRHNPLDLETHIDYLAPEKLFHHPIVIELEKVHELFPESTEIIWQLARRYHLRKGCLGPQRFCIERF